MKRGPAPRRPAPRPLGRAERAPPKGVTTRFQPVVQTKLRVGAPDDQYEKEADEIADQVMRMPETKPATQSSPISRRGPEAVQRTCAACSESGGTCPECEEELQAKSAPGQTPTVTPPVQAQIDALRGGGQPLDPATRAFMESRFDSAFGAVRVHTNAQAAESARALKARAYTVGQDVVFGAGQYASGSNDGRRLLAHELTHVVQQGGATARPTPSEESSPSPASDRTGEQVSSQVSDVVQRAGDPAAIPPGLRCPTDLTLGAPAGTSVMFPVGGATITPAHTTVLTTFLATWLASGGTDEILVHGFASTEGAEGANWTLSCDRAEAVQAELIRLGIPPVRISVVAHGESTDFSPSRDPNQRAVVSTRAAGILPLPVVGGSLTPRDNFAGHSRTRFGVGEIIDLDFFSLPPTPAAGFGGLEWQLVSGGGALTGVNNLGTATYTAPPTADTVQLDLRVAGGATAGRVISSHTITIVIPTSVRMTEVAGSAPDFAGAIAPGTWGAGFRANPFIRPRDVSFQGVMFGEGRVAAVVTPAGSFLSARHGLVHAAGGLAPGGTGNATTGTPVLAVDNIATAGGVTPRTVAGISICGASDFLWAIPWEFSVAGGARTPFAGGFTANHHVTSTLFCSATIEKAGAGPFCRNLDGTIC